MSPSVPLDDSLWEELRTRVDESEFDSIEDYVEFVLSEVVKDHPELDGKRSKGTEQEQEDVKDNLRSLGYLE